VSAERPSAQDGALAADSFPAPDDPEARAADTSRDGAAAAVDGPLDEAAESGSALGEGVPDERDAEAGEPEAQADRTSEGSQARVTGAGEVLGGTEHPRDAPSGSADEHVLDDGREPTLGTDDAPDDGYADEVVPEGDVS
jgi:hypothetical protein